MVRYRSKGLGWQLLQKQEREKKWGTNKLLAPFVWLDLYGYEVVIWCIWSHRLPKIKYRRQFISRPKNSKKIKSRQKIILTGDLNTRVGAKQKDEVIGQRGENVVKHSE